MSDIKLRATPAARFLSKQNNICLLYTSDAADEL